MLLNPLAARSPLDSAIGAGVCLAGGKLRNYRRDTNFRLPRASADGLEFGSGLMLTSLLSVDSTLRFNSLLFLVSVWLVGAGIQ